MVRILLFLFAFSFPVSESLRFVAIGDWGNDDGRQYEVAAGMAQWAEFYHPEFVMSLGDNFYPEGVVSVNDSKWFTHWQFVSKAVLSFKCGLATGYYSSVS